MQERRHWGAIALVLGAAVALPWAAGCGDKATTTDGAGSGGASSSTANSGPGPGGPAGTTSSAGGAMPMCSETVAHPAVPCSDLFGTAPAVAEDGHYAAVTLTPPCYPFIAKEIEYQLLGSDNRTSCSSGIAHDVLIFVGDSAKPIATPSSSETFLAQAIPPAANEPKGRLVTVTLDPPIELSAGQHLIVAVQLRYDETTTLDSMCLQSCPDAATIDDNWWSFSPAEPFAWKDQVADGSYKQDYVITMRGMNP